MPARCIYITKEFCDFYFFKNICLIFLFGRCNKLLQSGADISIKDKTGNTALEIASDHNEIIKILEEHLTKQNEKKTNVKRRGGTKKKKNRRLQKNE